MICTSLLPDEVKHAIAAAEGSLYGIPGDPGAPGFGAACNRIRDWAQACLEDDPLDDDDGPIDYDVDGPCRSAQTKLRDLVGPELYPYVR